MTMPPRLSGAALFWWGIGVLVGGVVARLTLDQVLGSVYRNYLWDATASGMPAVEQILIAVVVFLDSLLTPLGVGLICASLVVAALTPSRVSVTDASSREQ